MSFFVVHPGSRGVAAPLAWPSLQAAAARTEQRRDQPLADRRLLYSFARNHASTLFIVAVRRRSTRVAPKPGECLRVADFSRRQARAASTLGSRLSRQRRPQARACARAQTCCSSGFGENTPFITRPLTSPPSSQPNRVTSFGPGMKRDTHTLAMNKDLNNNGAACVPTRPGLTLRQT